MKNLPAFVKTKFTLFNLPFTYKINKTDLKKKYHQLVYNKDKDELIKLKDSYETLNNDFNRANYLSKFYQTNKSVDLEYLIKISDDIEEIKKNILVCKNDWKKKMGMWKYLDRMEKRFYEREYSQ